MSWGAVPPALATVLAVPLGMLATAVLVWPLLGLVADAWQLPMLAWLQPWRTWWRLGLVAAGILFALNLVLGPGHVAGKLLACAVLAARPTLWWVRCALWRDLDDDARAAAAALREELGAHEGDPGRITGRPWRSLVFDVERARRRARYEPPPI